MNRSLVSLLRHLKRRKTPLGATARVGANVVGLRHATVVAPNVTAVGGQERFAWELVSGLLSRGYEVTVISRRCEIAASTSLRWVRVRAPDRPGLLGFPLFVLLASAEVARARRGPVIASGAIILNRVDVAVVHHLLDLARRRGIVSRSRDSLAYRVNSAWSLRLRVALEIWCYRERRVRHLVAVSKGTKQDVSQRFPKMASSITVIPLGCDHIHMDSSFGTRGEIRRELGVSDQARVALFLGGDWERKRLAVALRGVVQSQHWQLVVVGPGSRKRFDELAKATGAAAVAVYVGRVPAVERYLRMADAFVLPSEYEGFSIATYEAAMAGLPLLVSRVHGVEDLLVDGQNGWFLSADPAELAARLSTLENDEIRRDMGLAARAAVREFRWADTVGKYIVLLERPPNRA